MKRILYILAGAVCLTMSCMTGHRSEDTTTADATAFVRIDGHDLINPDGTKLFIRGTNLGNWLNPEGYMFGFKHTSSPRLINEMLCQLVGEDAAADFWRDFKDNYITRQDIELIAATGANTVRMPFHYKLFTDEDYMGLTAAQDGFARIDSCVAWCRDNGLYLILDMHDAPGGQTGDNIDDSYGYPWLMESERAQQQFLDIWEQIARRYANEPVILGYELINEPVATYFDNQQELNAALEPLHKRAVEAIRRHDSNHIVLLGAPQWNSNFEPFTDWSYDDKLMYTCHRYGGSATAEAIGSFIAFRDSTGLPMYMGEIGHNTMEWQDDFCNVLEDNNIGYTFWPYKKVDESCMVGIERPEGWQIVVDFAAAPRSSYAEVRAARADTAAIGAARTALRRFIENCRAENCIPQNQYIQSIHLKPLEF